MKTIGIKWWGLLLGIVLVSLLATAALSARLQPGMVPGPPSWAPVRGEVVTSVFQVENLACSVCLNTIGNQLRGLQGTVSLDADLANRLVFVGHQKDLSGEMIAEKISAAGYPARFLGSGRRIRAAASADWVSGYRRPCAATAEEWKELFHRYFGK